MLSPAYAQRNAPIQQGQGQQWNSVQGQSGGYSLSPGTPGSSGYQGRSGFNRAPSKPWQQRNWQGEGPWATGGRRQVRQRRPIAWVRVPKQGHYEDQDVEVKWDGGDLANISGISELGSEETGGKVCPLGRHFKISGRFSGIFKNSSKIFENSWGFGGNIFWDGKNLENFARLIFYDTKVTFCDLFVTRSDILLHESDLISYFSSGSTTFLVSLVCRKQFFCRKLEFWFPSRLLSSTSTVCSPIVELEAISAPNSGRKWGRKWWSCATTSLVVCWPSSLGQELGKDTASNLARTSAKVGVLLNQNKWCLHILRKLCQTKLFSCFFKSSLFT